MLSGNVFQNMRILPRKDVRDLAERFLHGFKFQPEICFSSRFLSRCLMVQ